MDARLILDPPARGTWNMAVDEALFQTSQSSRQTTIRFYEWDEATLSLGYFQAFECRNTHAPSRDCPLVRRSTGGGAIVHDRELTYSLVTPLTSDRSAQSQQLVRRVHQSLIETLKSLGVTAHFAQNADRDTSTPILNSAGQSPTLQPFLCFQRRATDDVFIHGHKIAGSAQRKLHRTLLQHGSILLRRSPSAPELPGICDITGVSCTPRQLAEAWIGQLAEALMLDRPSHLGQGGRTSEERRLAEEIEQERFLSPQWNRRR
jgi:lipoate-protein ligase A